MRPHPTAAVGRMLIVPMLVIAGLSLSGCAAGSVGGGAETGVEEAIEGQSDGQADVDISGTGGADIPADWPSRVPLPPGEAISSATLGSAMSITYRMSDLATAEAHVDAIRNAGFTEVSSEIHDDGQVWIFTDGSLRVGYNFLVSDAGDGSVVGQIDVIEEAE